MGDALRDGSNRALALDDVLQEHLRIGKIGEDGMCNAALPAMPDELAFGKDEVRPLSDAKVGAAIADQQRALLARLRDGALADAAARGAFGRRCREFELPTPFAAISEPIAADLQSGKSDATQNLLDDPVE